MYDGLMRCHEQVARLFAQELICVRAYEPSSGAMAHLLVCHRLHEKSRMPAGKATSKVEIVSIKFMTKLRQHQCTGTPALLPSWLVAPPKPPVTKPHVAKAAAGSASRKTGSLKRAPALTAAAAAAAASARANALPLSASHHSLGLPLQLPRGLQPPQMPQMQGTQTATASGPTAAPAAAMLGGGALSQYLLQQSGVPGAMKRPVDNRSAKSEQVQPQAPQDTDAAAAVPAAKKRRVNRYSSIREQDRCGHCKTCLNRAMKKACLTRRAEADAIAQQVDAAAQQAARGIAAWPLLAPPAAESAAVPL